MIKGLTFDLWNTLLKNKGYRNERVDILHKFLESHNISLTFEEVLSLYSSFFNLHNYYSNISFRHISTETHFKRLFSKLQLDLPPSDFQAIFIQFEEILLKDPPELMPHVKKILAEIKTKWNLPFVLISDTGISPGKILNKVLEKYQILQYFQGTVYSDEIGYAKPHSIPFQSALDKIRLLPNEVMHIGDLLHTDILGAKNMHMKTVWVRTSSDIPITHTHPDYIIDTFDELPAIITKECN